MAREMSDRLLGVAGEVVAALENWDPVGAADLASRYVDLGPLRGDETPGHIARVLGLLALLDHRLGNLVEMERRCRTAVSQLKQDDDEDPAVLAVALYGLAKAQNELGWRTVAVRTVMEGLEVARRCPEHRAGVTLAWSLQLAAAYQLTAGEYGAAEQMGREAVTLAREMPAEQSMELHRSLQTLAVVYASMGSGVASVAIMREAAEISRAAGRPRLLFSDLINLAVYCSWMGRSGEAESLLEEAACLLVSCILSSLPNSDHV